MYKIIWLFVLLLGALSTQVLGGESVRSEAGRVAILYDDLLLLHQTGAGHPERPERLASVVQHLRADYGGAKQLYWPSFKQASLSALRRVHSADYLSLVEQEVSLVKQGVAVLSTGDTVISTKTNAVAKLAAGAAIAGVDEVMTGHATAAFALVRPPGHHATTSRGMGFCVYNNVAVAAKYLQQKYGIKRILIVDFDVHHGNGTQDIFYEDESVYYFSAHQSPLYPGTGTRNEVGSGKGAGTTLNVPVPAGADERVILKAMNAQLMPAMKTFKPEFILVSAGFDSHAGDLLGGLNYSHAGYGAITKALLTIAQPHGNNRIVYVLEGGYVPDNIKYSVASILDALLATKP